MLRKRRKDSIKIQIVENENVIKELIETEKCIYNTFQMTHDHIRVLVFVEKSSRLRFDSDTIKLDEISTTTSEKLNFLPPKNDTRGIGDLIFGEAQHMIESGSFKMHSVNEKLMISRLFSLPREKDIGSADFNLENDVRSAVQMWDMFIKKETNIQRHVSYFNTEPPEYLRKVSRARMSTMSRVPMKSEGYSISHGSSRRLGSSLKGLNVFRYTALAIIFDKPLHEFVYNYLHYIDREMKDLQHSLFDALCNDKKLFFYKAAIACQKFRANLISFNNALRLNVIVSASLKNSLTSIPNITSTFFQDFTELINIYETKESGYFLSKLISAVMMYHLTWVLSTNEVYAGKQESFWSLPEYYQNQSKPLLNALGCIGSLSHTTRIVVVGENVKQISQLLNILSYFIHIDHMPMNNAALESQREPNYSLNKLWPFTKTEFVTKQALAANQNPDIEFNVHDENLVKIADRWQSGEFGAMFAQKAKLRQLQTNDSWSIQYDLTDGDNLHFLRHRAKSEPHQLQSVDQEFSVEEFRPRSSSNPISRYKIPKRKPFKRPEKKDRKVVQHDYTTPEGKLPYGFTIPVPQNKKEKNKKRIQKYEASAVWKERPNRKLHDWKTYKNSTMEASSRSVFDSALPSTSSDYTPSEGSRPLSPVRNLTNSSPENFEREYSGAASTSSLLTHSSFDSMTSYRPPIRARRRKSITSLARAMARNCVYIHDPTNPIEEEELYEQFMDRLLDVEFSIDEFGDDLNDATDSSRFDVIKKLIGGVLEKFQPAFIMQGIDTLKMPIKNIFEDIKAEVQHPESFYITVPKENDNKKPSTNPRKILKTAGSEKKEVEYIQMTSVIIVANLDEQKITIHSGDVHTYLEEEMAYPCDIVQTMLENIRDMFDNELFTTKTIISSLQDKMENLVRRASQLHHFIESFNTPDDDLLVEILNKVSNESHIKLIKELMQRHYHAQEFDGQKDDEENNKEQEGEKIDASLLVRMLNCQYSDLRLLINICSVLSPLVRAAMS